jgi:type IV pilus assembly protein PilQ
MIRVQRTLGGLLGHRLRGLAIVSLWAVLASWAHAQSTTIDSITTTQQGPNTVVKIGLSAPIANPPAGFSVATPARVALDFPGVTNNTGKNSFESNQGDLRSISLVQAGERTRMVLNLKRLVNYTTAIDGNSVLVTLSPSSPDGSAVIAPVASRLSTGPSGGAMDAAAHSLRDVDFRRGPDGEGRVIIDLSDSQTGVDIKQQGQTVVVDFLKTVLPENLRRRLVVTDFATPVQTVNAFSLGDNTRVVIEPHGLWEYNAYQTDSRLVIEVKPVKEDPNKLFQGTGTTYKGDRLSLNFQNVEVRSLLQVIADFTNLNIITSDSVGGNLTLRLKDVPWDQALDIILQAKGLDKRKNGNVILIAPKDELTTKEKLELEARAAISDLEPTRSEVFQLNYQKADSVKAFLNGDPVPGAGGTPSASSSSGGVSARVLSKRGSASSDPRTNQLFVQDIPSKLETIRNLIARLDVPSRQVLIEARVVVADDGFTRELGNKLGYYNSNPNGEKIGNSGVNATVQSTYASQPYYATGVSNSLATLPQGCTTTNNVVTCSLSAIQGNTPLQTNQPFVSLPAGGAANPASIAISLFRAGSTRFLNLELSALEQDNHGKLISSPRVVTADQVKAIIEQGTELPYQVATSSGATSIQFQKANLKLEVTPQITPEGNVILTVDVTDDSVGQSTAAGYAIDTKHVNTQVLVENGGTVVLGGIYELNDRNDVNKVPFLGDIPYLGYFFKSSTRTYTKTELLVFITPKVISDKLAAQ